MIPPDLIDWDALDQGKFAAEEDAVARLLATPPLSAGERQAVAQEAAALVERTRTAGLGSGLAQTFLQEFSLDSREGLALMCIAESFLRTPDAPTRDLLIAEKLGTADWAAHLGHSPDPFVNASTLGLMLTGKLIAPDEEARRDPVGLLRRLVARAGEPIVRRAVAAALRIMGEQFVLGRTIGEALARARRSGMLCSFDMLGEGARTGEDAERYAATYAEAIAAVSGVAGTAGPMGEHGISIKLSALHPRFEATQEARVLAELTPRLLALATAAAQGRLNLTIDAEEADRTVLSLKLLALLAHDPSLARWDGLGIVVQAYQKRAGAVIAALARLARDSGRRLTVRLVKGAYWDSEIKAAQVAGMADYPVFTTRPATDVSFLACADALLAAAPALFPQFATHNAHTLTAVRHLARKRGVAFEPQRLHGMGEALYAAAGAGGEGSGDLPRPRVYAPVGSHEQLLPYLVRRLLENGANSSFVHHLADPAIPASRIAADPIARLAAAPGRHPRLPCPVRLHGTERRNPLGRDASQAAVRAAARGAVDALASSSSAAGPIVAGTMLGGTARQAVSPADPSRVIGRVVDADADHLTRAITAAREAQPAWDRAGGTARGAVLRRMGDALEEATDPLVALLALEGGKTYPDGVAELREAVDFCRYYALLAERQFGPPATLAGPVGERNSHGLLGRGVFACISPWNFPLAIFTGQVAAALAAGNAAIAKPAEQTPLVAAAAVRLFHRAGLDPRLLALLPGGGETIGAALVAQPGIDGVAFTGGTATAWAINRALAARPGPIVPLIAETGGLNAMFVDTTSLREQVLDDAITSAFGSSGQRCSALRMLFLPEESADDLLVGLAGALAVRTLGDPADPAIDIGPVIDAAALAGLERHLHRLRREARIVARHPGTGRDGYFFPPVIAEVERPDFLEEEVFGPILHVCRYARSDLPRFAARLAARGYGLTLGIHSRLPSFVSEVEALVPAGNVYVNRSMVGAVVGVQPFGGVGLSGTGPKAGGPHALLRFASERAVSVNIMAEGGDPALLGL